MILVDTSVWIDHLRNNEPFLVQLLNQNQVLSHPFVRGELALGNLQQRKTVLSCLDSLPQASTVLPNEINFFIERNSLFGLGIGLIDAHLLASVRLAANALLWTRDKRLLAVAMRMYISANIDAHG